MSWSWGHTHEAYENARENLGRLSVKTLIVILAEWRAWITERECSRCELGDAVDPNCSRCNGTGKERIESSSSSSLDSSKYEAERKELTRLAKCGLIHKDVLVDDIWERASNLATCTNGGHDAWMCPFGCHMVSFSTFSERMAEAKERKRNAITT